MCTGPACVAATTGETSVAGAPGSAPAVSRTDAACNAGATGCAVSSSAEAVTLRDSGIPLEDGTTLAGTAGSGQTSSQAVCPDAGCTATVNAGSSAAADGASPSPSTAGTACTGAAECVIGVSAGASTATAPGAKLATATTFAGAQCDAAGKPCATTAHSDVAAPGNKAVTDCAGQGFCTTNGTVTVVDGTPEVNVGCQGSGRCVGHAEGSARTSAGAAEYAVDCTAGAGRSCDVGGTAAAGPDGAGAALSCSGSTCTGTTSAQGGGKGTQTANASGGCSTGTGVCGIQATVSAGPAQAAAGAGCAGPAGSTCRYDVSTRSNASASSAGSRADADASGTGSGTFGTGEVSTFAQAEASPGAASAQSGCAGTGVTCSHSFSASAQQSARGARASASGSDSGGAGAGGVAVTAQASSGRGAAQASASCFGAANCRHSYSASISASAPGAHASASGSGGGGQGSGSVAVTATAAGGPGWASASASCFGTANCRHSYSAHASQSAAYDGAGPNGSVVHNRASANASGSGGGGQGGGGVSVTARATAGPNGAQAMAGCSGVSNCSASFSTQSWSDAYFDELHHSTARAACSGGGSGGYCATSAVAVADAKSASAGASCAGSAGVACSHSFSATSGVDEAVPGGHLKGTSTCGSSGGMGGSGCGTVGYAEDGPDGVRLMRLGCEGPGCKFSGTGDITAKNLIAEGKTHQECNGVGDGSCTIGIKAKLSTDRDKENIIIDVLGFCSGTEGVSCKGDYSATVTNGGISKAVCNGTGSGGCHGETLTGDGRPVAMNGVCIKDMACDWRVASTSQDHGVSKDGEFVGDAFAQCSTSSAQGGTGCTTSALVTVLEHGVQASAGCNGVIGTGTCTYRGETKAKADSEKNNADANHKCSQDTVGYCGVVSMALAQGGDEATMGDAQAGGSCEGSAGTKCEGTFNTHVDSNRDTLSNCHGVGSGSCHGNATPKEAWSEGIGVGTIDSVSPDERKEGKFNTGPDGPATRIGAKTNETVGRWFINAYRDVGTTTYYLPKNVWNFVGDVGTHFGNWGELAFTGDGSRPGESSEAWAERRFPRTAAETYQKNDTSEQRAAKDEAYKQRVWPLKATWDHSMETIGNIVTGKAGDDLYWKPLSTTMAALSGPMMIIPVANGVAGIFFKGGSRAAAAGVFRVAADGAKLSIPQIVGRGAMATGRGAMRVANGIFSLPFKPYTMAGRALAFGAGKGLGFAALKLGARAPGLAGGLSRVANSSLAIAGRTGTKGAIAAFRDPTVTPRANRPMVLAGGKAMDWAMRSLMGGRTGAIAGGLRAATESTLAWGRGYGPRNSIEAGRNASADPLGSAMNGRMRLPAEIVAKNLPKGRTLAEEIAKQDKYEIVTDPVVGRPLVVEKGTMGPGVESLRMNAGETRPGPNAAGKDEAGVKGVEPVAPGAKPVESGAPGGSRSSRLHRAGSRPSRVLLVGSRQSRALRTTVPRTARVGGPRRRALPTRSPRSRRIAPPSPRRSRTTG